MKETKKFEEKKIGRSYRMNRIEKWYWTLVIALAPFVSEAADFMPGLQKAMGYGVLISIVACVFFIYEGIQAFHNGTPYGKYILCLILSASAIAITSALYAAFGITAEIKPAF